MRSRIIASPAFTGDRVIGAILFEMTMDRQIEWRGSAEYLWDEKRVVPFLKVDKGLAEEENGVQLMKPIPGLDELLERAKGKGVFGTKMRSVVKLANPEEVAAIVEEQFAIGKQIADAGLVPIFEPEVDIRSPEKAEAEALLRAGILDGLADVDTDRPVMFELSLPSEDGFYADLVSHPKVVRVVALPGGHTRDEANEYLARNHGVIASFSRALVEGLFAQQTDEEFNGVLDGSIQAIYEASIT